MRKNHGHFIGVSKGNWTRVNRSILFREIDSNIQITLQFPLISEEFRLLKSKLNAFSKKERQHHLPSTTIDCSALPV